MIAIRDGAASDIDAIADMLVAEVCARVRAAGGELLYAAVTSRA